MRGEGWREEESLGDEVYAAGTAVQRRMLTMEGRQQRVVEKWIERVFNVLAAST